MHDRKSRRVKNQASHKLYEMTFLLLNKLIQVFLALLSSIDLFILCIYSYLVPHQLCSLSFLLQLGAESFHTVLEKLTLPRDAQNLLVL